MKIVVGGAEAEMETEGEVETEMEGEAEGEGERHDRYTRTSQKDGRHTCVLPSYWARYCI